MTGEKRKVKFSMKNLPLLLATIIGSLILIVGLALMFSQPPKSSNVDLEKLIAGASHTKGSEAAPVTIVEFSDFQCPACRGAQSLVSSVAEQYPDQVRLVFRHFPLDSIHPNARRAAEAAVAMESFGKFWEYNAVLFDNQDQWEGAASTEELDVFLKKFATDLQVEEASFSAKLAEESAGQVVSSDVRLANELGLNSTPTFFVNGNQVSAQQLSQAVEEALRPEGG
jgi:protein-disulfide isomerase